MREFMKIVESQVVDGYVSGVSPTELAQLVANKGDLRGVAYRDVVYLSPASYNLHFGMRNDLGIPTDSEIWNDAIGEYEDVADYGFDFYVAPTEAMAHHEIGHSEVDDDGGRDDWSGGSSPFEVGSLTVVVGVEKTEALTNRQFRRMIGGQS